MLYFIFIKTSKSIILLLTNEYKMHQSPKCGSFPTVDKRHLQAGISQEYQAEIKAESTRNLINNIGVLLLILIFQSLFAYLVLFGDN